MVEEEKIGFVYILVLLFWGILCIYRLFGVSEWDETFIDGVRVYFCPVDSVTFKWDTLYYINQALFCFVITTYLISKEYISVNKKVAKISSLSFCILLLYEVSKLFSDYYLEMNLNKVFVVGFVFLFSIILIVHYGKTA